jgi:hypothetical protein
MTDDINREPSGGGYPKSPKKTRGRGWLARRHRHGKSWRERKMRSFRYCPATTARGA